MMKIFGGWKDGRQGTGYKKLTLLFFKRPIPFDLYLIKFGEGSFIPPHIDPVEDGLRHYRLNIILKKPVSGGQFNVPKAIINLPRLKFFRPDVHQHSVTRINEGSRLVLSLGWVLKSKRQSKGGLYE